MNCVLFRGDKDPICHKNQTRDRMLCSYILVHAGDVNEESGAAMGGCGEMPQASGMWAREGGRREEHERQMTVTFFVRTHSPNGAARRQFVISSYFHSQTSTSSLHDVWVTGCNHGVRGHSPYS